MSIAETTSASSRPKIVEQQKSEQAQKTAQAQKDVKKIARAKLARERKHAVLARLRQQREQREDALALSYANQPFNSPPFSPFGQRAEY
jgi:hypothetical protein